MPYVAGMVDPCFHADMSGTPYQLAHDLVNRSLRDYIFFADSPNHYYLLFCDDLNYTEEVALCPAGQEMYYIVHHTDTNDDYWTCTYFSNTGIVVDNTSHCLVYSSDKSTPDLRGGSRYAIFLCCLGVGFCCWVLLDHIFRRFY